MAKFKMTCSCGDTMTVEASDRDDAVQKLKDMMDEPALEAHMAEKHPGDPVMSVAECHAMIEEQVEMVEEEGGMEKEEEGVM